MNRRRDMRDTVTGPERAASRSRFETARTASASVKWFNLREQHANGQQPTAMQTALAKALGKRESSR